MKYDALVKLVSTYFFVKRCSTQQSYFNHFPYKLIKLTYCIIGKSCFGDNVTQGNWFVLERVFRQV